MRIIVEAFGRAFAWETNCAMVKVRSLSEVEVPDEEAPEETIKFDPRSTTSAHLERRSAVEDLYGKQPFGFGKTPRN